MLNVRCVVITFGLTAAVLVQFAFVELQSRSSNGAEGGLFGCASLLFWLLFSTWLRRRHIFNPAQNLSKLSFPFGGVTFWRLSKTPFGRPFVPSSCHLFSMSLKSTYPVRLSSMMSKRVLMAWTNCFGRLSTVVDCS